MKILVTGAKGFIGQAVRRVVSSESSLYSSLNFEFWNSPLEDIAKYKSNVDAVIHLAQRILPSKLIGQDLEEIFNRNIESCKSVSRFAERAQAHILFLSSSSVYGVASENKPVKESHPLKPINANGINKLRSEEILREASQAKIFPLTIFRLFNAYGPGQKEPFLIPTLFNSLIEDRPIIIRNGSAVRDLVYVDDVARALLKALDVAPGKGKVRVFNLGSQVELSVNEILARVEESVGKKAVMSSSKELTLDQREVSYMVADLSQVKSKLTWAPSVDLEKGLSLTYSASLRGRIL